MMKRTALTLISASLLTLVAACNGGGQSPQAAQQQQNNNTFESLLTKATGDTYIQVKAVTYVNGYSVFQDTNTGAFVAYNLAKFNPVTMTSIAQYLAVATNPNDVVQGLTENVVTTDYAGYYSYYTDIYGNTYSTWNPGYSTTEFLYQNGNWTFEAKRTNSKDLEKLAANAAKADTAAMQVALTMQYGFSEERAAKVATLTKQMKEIAGTRELTDADKDLFSKEALGVDYKSLKDSVKKSDEGDRSAFGKLLQQAAATNGTTPEQSRQLIEDMAAQAD